jgi:site-specific recombinase XerD
VLIGGGIDFKTASELLGDSVAMTMNTYSHVTSDMIDAATAKINMLF